MKIAFITPSVSRTSGGIFEIERKLAQSLVSLPDTEVQVCGLEDSHTHDDLPAWRPLCPRAFPVSGPRAFGYSAELLSAFLMEEADIAHSHALWMYPSVVVHRWARAKKRPYLVTLNGMLDPWAVRNSAWKKRIALFLYERRCLKDAACIQVNTHGELQSARSFGLRNPIAVIPNGIDLPGTVNQASGVRAITSNLCPLASGRNVMLYLGRIHPKKGLVNLLKAWRHAQKANISTQNSDWVLAIAGWDQNGHEGELKRLAAELGLLVSDARDKNDENCGREAVAFLGPQFNEAKAACYRASDAFVLPSFSEGLPMAVLEAWSYAKPVLMTPECNLPEGFSTNAALRIETTVDGIQNGLNALFAMSPTDRDLLGSRGRDLVAARFTWPKVAAEMKTVYEWLLGSRSMPASVVVV